ncbi:MAG: putative Ig domain-containing protein, partial [Gemmataceae bacterium]
AGLTAWATVTLNVNGRVVVAPVADRESAEGDAVTVAASAESEDGHPLTYSLAGQPSGVTIDATTGLISGTIAAGTALDAAYAVTVTATDGTDSGSVTFLWVVDTRVTVEPLADRQDAEGASVHLPVSATSPGGGAFAYSATGLPAGLSISPTTGLIAGTIAAGAATAGTPRIVTVTVTQGPFSASRTFEWVVNGRVVSDGLVAQSDSYSGVQDERVTVGGTAWGAATLLENDSAASGGALAVTAINGSAAAVGEPVTLPSGATVTVASGGTFDYDPAPGFTGVDTFTYTVANALFSAAVPVFINLQAPAAAESELGAAVSALMKSLGTKTLTLDQINAEATKLAYAPAEKRAQAVALMVLQQWLLRPPGVGEVTYRDTFNLRRGETTVTESSVAIFNGRLAKGEDRARKLNAFFKKQLDRAKEYITTSGSSAAEIDKLIWGKDCTVQERVDQIFQGGLADCSFMAALIGATRTWTTAQLKGRISLDPTTASAARRVFIVRMFDSKGRETPVRVEEPTITERLNRGGARGGSLWVALFEQAHVQLRAKELSYGRYIERAGAAPLLHYHIESRYATTDAAIRMLTGKSDFRYFNDQFTADGKTIRGLSDPQIISVIEDITAKPRLVTFSTIKEFVTETEERLKRVHGLYPGHAYAVIAYDRVLKIVTLRDPLPHPDPTRPGPRDVPIPIADLRKVFVFLAASL